ncbi:unnamed protein product [Calypogeia fissa]
MGRSVAAIRRLQLLQNWANSRGVSGKWALGLPLHDNVGYPDVNHGCRRNSSCKRNCDGWDSTIFRVGGHSRSFSVTSVRDLSQKLDGADLSQLEPKLPIEKLLIANRGEIACRVIRTARRLGIKSVAVFSDVDKNAKHVQLADEAVHIGPAPATQSYLRGPAIVCAALATGAHAIHPGYGFLSENVQFAELCKKQGISFLGPPSSAIHAMGDKSVAKKLMSGAGVPVVPGYHDDDQTFELLRDEANRIGYPVLIKATQGGGGKGMRIVHSESEFSECLNSAQREALAAFGNSQVLIEKYLLKPRHIEVQIFGDKHGNVVHLFERDCSVQRRHQKIIEEAPAPGLTEEFRKEIGLAAVNAAKAVGYESAGTVEFIFDTTSGKFYFMEMNTRLQVEHPITEMITGQDLVEWQIRVANGELLPMLQDELKLSGHAFEARIYAENVPRGFLPASGTLRHYSPPPVSGTVRVETGVGEGDTVSVYYDPMIAKLVTWGYNRSAALTLLDNCLSKFQIAGLPTNIPFLRTLSKHPAFMAGDVGTDFIDKYRPELLPTSGAESKGSVNSTSQDIGAARKAAAVAVVGMCLMKNSTPKGNPGLGSMWSAPSGFRLNHSFSYPIQLEWKSDILDNFSIPIKISVTHNKDSTFKVKVEDENPLEVIIKQQKLGDGDGSLRLDVDGLSATITLAQYFQGDVANLHLWQGDQHYHYSIPWQLFDSDESNEEQVSDKASGKRSSSKSPGAVTAPMAGRVVKVFMENGAHVKRGDSLLVLEAMKMEHVVKAEVDGVIEKASVVVGQQVSDSTILLQIKVPA